jgi:hypothetical protein
MVSVFFEAVQESIDYLVSYGLNIISIIIGEFIFYFTALLNFIQINSQNTGTLK